MKVDLLNMTFDDFYNFLPIESIKKLMELKKLTERSDYHPELNTFEHIKIVTNRLLKYDDIDLVFAGVYHDICKLDAGRKWFKHTYGEDFDEIHFNKLRDSAQLKTYGHDSMGADYINKIDIQTNIKLMGGNPEIISDIVKNHQRIKSFNEMKGSKRINLTLLPAFSRLLIIKEADNMVKEWSKYNYLSNITI